jgi:hypothetical protein
MGSASSRFGSVSFDGDYVTIQPKGGLVGALSGKKTVRIPLRSIKYIQFHAAGMVAEGFFCVNTGQQDHGGSLGQPAALEAKNDPNAILFGRSAEREFVALRDEVEVAIAKSSGGGTSSGGSAPSSADQLAQLASLRDQGILSEDEFAVKKKEILARM